jgi:hypothetical protein
LTDPSTTSALRAHLNTQVHKAEIRWTLRCGTLDFARPV